MAFTQTIVRCLKDWPYLVKHNAFPRYTINTSTIHCTAHQCVMMASNSHFHSLLFIQAHGHDQSPQKLCNVLTLWGTIQIANKSLIRQVIIHRHSVECIIQLRERSVCTFSSADLYTTLQSNPSNRRIHLVILPSRFALLTRHLIAICPRKTLLGSSQIMSVLLHCKNHS